VFAEFPNSEIEVRGRPLWRVRDMLYGVALLLLALIAVLAAIALLDSSPSDGGAGADAAMAAWTIVFELLFGGAVLLLARRRGLRSRDLGFVRPQRWAPAAMAWGGAYAVLIAYGALLLALDGIGVNVSAFEEGNALPADLARSPQVLLLFAIAVVAVAPISEELFFRGLLFRGLRGYWRMAPSLALSGLAFGLFHLTPGVLLPFALIGMLFGWANEQTRSLWTSIVAHTAFNGVNFLATIAFATA
jgi:membrane protease YdiL (CAAX protease family)